MSKIFVERHGQRRELSLVELFGIGLSFALCRERHVWPTIHTFEAFLRFGCDDVADGSVVRWDGSRVGESDYLAAVGAVDAEFRIDDLGIDEGDWKAWFERAVHLPIGR